MKEVNLHIHTNASDGLFAPSKVVDLAKKNSLSAIAITDHDSISGIDEAVEQGKRNNVEVISGVELSLEIDRKITCHLLGYFIDHKDENLLDILKKISTSRDNRNKKILQKLNDLGFKIEYDELVKKAGKKKNLGRVHIAGIMYDKGYVPNMKEAFNKWLGKGKPAYFDRFRLPLSEAVEIIHLSHGLAVLAHPGEGYPSKSQFRSVFDRLVTAGLDGLEIYYPSHTHLQKLFFEDLADDNDLLRTGGSDFHGYSRRDIWHLNPPLNYDIVDQMKIRRKRYESSKFEQMCGIY